MSVILTVFIAFLSIIVPGFFLSLALLRKTKLHMIEITVIGFIFGLIFPPVLTWLESYLMDYIHFFSFSAGLYQVNVLLLTAVGVILCLWQGVIQLPSSGTKPGQGYKQRLGTLRQTVSSLNIDMKMIREHEQEEDALAKHHSAELGATSGMTQEEQNKIRQQHSEEERRLMEGHESEEGMLLEKARIGNEKGLNMQLVWAAVVGLMLITFATRVVNLGSATHFFEFDPYFDMLSTESILTFGYQYFMDHSAWPTAMNGTAHRLEPIVPYLEAYWYDIANPPTSSINIDLLSNTSAFYPPICAALLVFVVFMFLYHEYGKIAGLIGAALAAAMPALITTLVAGEQLLEPWGIFAMFFFYASYLLAINNKKELRYAVLTGIAFASTFLGAHYYTVNAGVFALYIVGQGVIDVLKKKDMIDFYKMNAVIILIISAFYALFDPYSSVLFDRIPSTLGIPVIISFPLIALLMVAVFDYGPKVAKERNIIRSIDMSMYLAWLAIILVITLILVLATPVGKPVMNYLALTSKFTTPSIPLFLTVQEYEPTGFNFNFGSAGFGIIGASVGGINAVVWLVLIAFTVVALIAIFKHDSNSSMLLFWIIWPLAIGGMIEIKYLPHFGVAYILAIAALFGELYALLRRNETAVLALSVVAVGMIILESASYISVFSAVGVSCSTLSSGNNSLGASMFCNVVPTYWLNALSWIKTHVGPLGPRVLTWWDYGDWINWFGNSNAVLRGDNAVATLDYATAARFVLGPKLGYDEANLANFSDSIQAKYVLFDDQLTAKWQALDFLACVHANQTSRAFAMAAANGTSSPYVLGTSQCEVSHSPAILLVPINTSSISSYCSLQKKNVTFLKAYEVLGSSFLNQTFCLPLSNETIQPLYYPNGTQSNAEIVAVSQFYYGLVKVQGETFISFMVLYKPNVANGTITNAPSDFYQSNYYKGFYLGSLKGFKMVYPVNGFTGMNYAGGGSHPIVIYELENYTGSNVTHIQKPSCVQNNFTMPG